MLAELLLVVTTPAFFAEAGRGSQVCFEHLLQEWVKPLGCLGRQIRFGILPLACYSSARGGRNTERSPKLGALDGAKDDVAREPRAVHDRPNELGALAGVATLERRTLDLAGRRDEPR